MDLRIYTFGRFRVRRNNTPIPDSAWKTQKNKSLLKILLTHRQHSVTTEQLMEWLWPDKGPDAAGRNLRVAVSQLRRVLEPDLAPRAQSSFVLTTDAGYTWNTEADYWLDVDEFEALAVEFSAAAHAGDVDSQIASAERAKALYRGEYLEEDRYADWATAERERLRERYFTLLTRMAELYARQGRYRRATTLCREVLAVDNCRESVWCQLMLYHYHAGNQALAGQAYEECRQALAEELGVEPMPETVSLAEQIRRRRVVGEPSYPAPAAIERLRHLPLSLGHTPFVGRETEYAQLIDHLKQASAGQGGVVLIGGEAGVGKTRLVEEGMGYARQHGVVILEGCCSEEGGRPYQPIIEALRLAFHASLLRLRSGHGFTWNVQPSTLAAVAGLLPELRQTHPDLPDTPPLSPEQEKARLFEALAQLLLATRITDGQDLRINQSVDSANPLLFFLDDLHWADASTLDFLDYFATRISHAPVLILGTLRSEEVGVEEGDALARLLWTLKRRGVLHRLALKPLSLAAVVQLLQALSGSLERESRLGQPLYTETEGNPLFLVSVLQALFEDGLLTVDETGAWSVATPRLFQETEGLLSTRMHQVIRRRLRRLRDEERQVLEAAAVLGREFQWPVLSRMRAWRRDVLLDRLDRLMVALLIRERGPEGYSFSHDKVRQVAYEGITEERRNWLHSKAGEAMEAVYAGELDEVAGTLADHFQAAGHWERAFSYRLQAGWYAARLYANAEAMEQYQAALGLVGQDGFSPAVEDLREVHERLGDLYQTAGQYSPARDHFVAARRHAAVPADRVRLLYKLAHNHGRQGHAGPSHELLRQAVEVVDRLGVDQVGYLEAARTYARWAIMGSMEHGQSEAEHYARQAVSILEQHFPGLLHGETTSPWAEYDTVHSVLINAGEAFRFWGRWSEAAKLFQQSLAVAEYHEDPNGIGYSCNNWGDVRLAQGDFPGARTLYERAAESWAVSGHVWLEMAARTHLGLAWACEGRWDEAVASLEQARAAGEGMDPTQWLAEVYLWLSLAELHHTGDEDRTRDYRERAVAVAEAAGQTLPEHLRHLVMSVSEAQAGRLEAAREHFSAVRTVWEIGRGDMALYGQWILPQCKPPALPDA